jgi:anti-sigma B factor antagonist
MSDFTTEQHDDVVILHLPENLNSRNIQQAEDTWLSLLKDRPNILALNFRAIQSIDSLGLSHLVKLSRKTIMEEVELVLYDIPPMVHELFKIASLDRYFNILTEYEFQDKILGK